MTDNQVLSYEYQERVKNIIEISEGQKKRKSAKLAFESSNMSKSSMLMKELYQIIEEDKLFLPPRSGHIGNWNDIMEGYVKERNDNTIICGQRNLGFPLIFDLTQTENANLDSGDLTYLPGTYIEHGKRTLLPLYTWDGFEFTERQRDQSFLVPLTFTKVNEKLVSLSEFHFERYQKYQDKQFCLFSKRIWENCDEVKRILQVLFEHILKTGQPTHELKFMVNRYVQLNGVISKEGVQIENDKFIVGDCIYSIESFIDAIIYIYKIGAEPQKFLQEVKSAPKCMPMLSNHMTVILSFLFCNQNQIQNSTLSDSSQLPYVHYEWGGIEMAGYAPKESGYFSHEIKYIRRIYKILFENIENMPEVHYILIPSAIFLIWPNNEFPEDINSLNVLIDMVLKETADCETKNANTLYSRIVDIVNTWVKGDNNVSELFRRRFSKRKPPMYSNDDKIQRNEFLEPDGFKDLTIQQATMIVSALHEYYQE